MDSSDGFGLLAQLLTDVPMIAIIVWLVFRFENHQSNLIDTLLDRGDKRLEKLDKIYSDVVDNYSAMVEKILEKR